MPANRRHFLASSAALAASAALRVHASPTQAERAATQREDPTPAGPKPLDILILGGTGFVGPHQVERALERGHRVTIFNRGRREGLFGDRVEELVGDRDSEVGAGLSALEGDRRWDVVFDNSAYVPRHARDSAELLRDRVGRYVFISTVAAYNYDAAPLVDGVRVADRTSPTHPAPEPATERVTGQSYGPLKAECERALLAVLGDRATIVRPCYIVGPGDSSDRFTYWVERLHEGGDVVCPADPGKVMQWIDVRDLCAFLVHLSEQDTSGVFNAVGPASTVTNREALWGLRGFASTPTTLHWPSACLLYTSPSPRDQRGSRMPSSA